MGLMEDNKYHLKRQPLPLGSFASRLLLKPFGKLEHHMVSRATAQKELMAEVFSVTSVSDEPV